ncbi:MAG: O-antigen ligase family protein, partial [Chloroflexi bacterium]|nr:O-antigen ligase family protein [Chloroflexota bacterium]
GVPLSLAVVILFWGGRRAVIGLAGLAAAGVVAAIPLSQSPRFADTFNFTSGTSFFRIQLWRSVISMITDHPWLGVGLDNFLYAYRGKYILPEAWQEPNLAHAHNIILDSLARLGLFGFVATLWMLSAFFLTAYTTLKRLTDPDLRALTIGLIASMIYTLAHGMVDTGYWFVDLAFVFMMTMGMMKKLESGE